MLRIDFKTKWREYGSPAYTVAITALCATCFCTGTLGGHFFVCNTSLSQLPIEDRSL